MGAKRTHVHEGRNIKVRKVYTRSLETTAHAIVGTYCGVCGFLPGPQAAIYQEEALATLREPPQTGAFWLKGSKATGSW